MAPTLYERFQNYVLNCGMLLSIAIYYFFLTVFETVFVNFSPLVLFDIQKLRGKAFARFWEAITPPATSGVPDPLQSAHFQKVPALLATATGTVLDVGPGTGSLFPLYRTSPIRRIYAAEPVLELHEALKLSANAVGIDDKLEILHCGAEAKSLVPALAKAGLLQNGGKKNVEGVFDTIVCIRVLCSVPDLTSTIETLYRLLRPGGQFIICEHVINPWRTSQKGSIIGRGFQRLYTLLGWPFFIGDCHLDRDTANLLRDIGNAQGGWKSVETEEHGTWGTIPFVTGAYVKK
ncbi:MAG: hypothetical protein MMC33_002856 [Icmadophila ericetorum]|nr:hypothetical protein [Icmadophila ericetorum]